MLWIAMLLQILWELVKSRDLDSMLALVPDEVVDALQQRWVRLQQ